jgi:outer membrane protein
MMRRLALLVLLLPAAAPAAERTLTLDEAVRTARANHPGIRQAQAQTDAAKARADQARSFLFPQLNANAQFQKSDSENQNQSLQGGSSTFWSGSLNASLLLWDFGRTTGGWDAAKASAEAQARTGEVTVQQVLLTVRTAYFTARAQKALLEVAKETLANQEKHLGQVMAFVQVGTQPEIALAQSKTDVANARLAMIRADNNYAVGRAQLNLAMGIEGSTDYDVADETVPTVDGEEGTTDALVAEAIRARPELASLRAQLMAQDATITAARGNYFPSFGASASVSESGSTLDSLGWGWSVGVNMTWPLFSGFGTRAQVAAAKYGRVAIDAQAVAERQQVRLEVEQARLSVRAAKAEIGAAEEALVNAREQLRLAEGRYETGVGNIIELGDAQVAFTNASAQKVQSDYDLATARVTLLHTLAR